MIAIIINWIYMLITMYVIGHFLLKRLARVVGFERQISTSVSVVFGLSVLTAYAGYVSIIGGVGVAANAIVIVICAIFAWFDKDDYRCLLTDLKSSCNVWQWLILIIILVAGLYFTAYGKFAYDTGLYHAQSIHWIEKYGVVKGLAYMQTRLAFNSAYFCLCALYSFHDFGQSLHATSGFVATFTMWYAAIGFFRLWNTKSKLIAAANFVRLSPFIYFIVICQELISPTTDFITIYLIIWISVRWMELLDQQEKEIAPYAVLCVTAVFLVSIKLSVGVLALLVLKPAYELIRQKRYRDIGFYIILGVVLILPYFIRNVLISGWLVYPLASVDLFSVDWKIPVSDVKYEADEIVVWARYTKDANLIGQSIREWFPVWWQEQGRANRYLSMTAFLSCGLAFVHLVQKGIHLIKMKTAESGYIFFEVIMIVNFLFWLISAPSNRFGYSYLIVLPLAVAGSILASHDKKLLQLIKWIAVMIMVIPMLFGLLLLLREDCQYARQTLNADYLVCQKDYPTVETGCKTFDGLEISFPVEEGSQIWYHAFPAILYEGNLDSIERRGDTVRDGFRLKEQRE